MALHTHTQGRFNNHIAHNLNSIMVTATSVVGVMKMGNITPIAGLEPISVSFQASVLPLHNVGFPDVTTIPTPTCVCSSLPQRSLQSTTQAMHLYIIHTHGLVH